MDEPLNGGSKTCQLSMENIASLAASYAAAIKKISKKGGLHNNLKIGDIEPYPKYSVSELISWIKELEKNEFYLDFFHLDIYMYALKSRSGIDVITDLRALQEFCRKEHIPFGVILWSGYGPLNSDHAYYDHTMDLVRQVKEAIGRPDQMIFQSWIKRSSTSCGATDQVCRSVPCTPEDPPYCGQRSIPLNLPENDPNAFTHTRLINDALNLLNYP